MPLNIVFLWPQTWSRPKTLLLKHDFRRHGRNSLKFRRKSFFLPNFRPRNLKIQSPKNAIPTPKPFHTPTRLPPLVAH